MLAADPGATGAITWERFTAVVQARAEQLDVQRRQQVARTRPHTAPASPRRRAPQCPAPTSQPSTPPRSSCSTTPAYVALGGLTDHFANVSSDALLAITGDFCGTHVAVAAVATVQRHRKRAVQAVLDMGGELEEEEEEELRNTKHAQALV